MTPKTKKFLKSMKIKKIRPKKAANILSKKNVTQIKSASPFQELTVGMVIPCSLGSFKVINELAIGRCCEVYIGENVSSKCQEAIKVFIRQQHYKGALLRELKFVAKLSPHPHIVVPKGSFQYEGRDILIHELLSGTLKDILSMHETRQPSTWLVSTLATHLMKGLAHMHKHGVVHGDLKPHNIMWSGQEGTFKLIDFGVSFSLTENMEHAVQSRAYQAPETILWNQWVQLKGASHQPPPPSLVRPGPAVDVWSAGCIVAEVLTGGKVFVFGWDGEDVEEALKESLQKVEGKKEDFLSQAFLWLRGCLEESPEKRWSADRCESAEFLGEGVSENPLFFDTLILPTTVVRVIHLARAEMEQSLVYELVETVVGKACSVAPLVAPHALDQDTGSLFLPFADLPASETAFHHLKFASVGGFSLVVSFFPRDLFERRIFF